MYAWYNSHNDPVEVTVLILILHVKEKGELFLKSLLNAIVFTEVARSHLSSPIFPISFSLYHSPPPKVSFVDQFFLLAYRAFSWFFYLHKDCISKDLHLSSRVNLSVLNTWDFGSASQCQAKGYCEFLAFLLWTPETALQIHPIYITDRKPRKGAGLPEEKHTAHVRAGSIKVWNILLLPEDKNNFKDALMTS